MLVRETTTAAGSAGADPNHPSGMGCSHGTSGRAAASGASGSSAGPPSPDGSGRRPRVSSARRHALVAIRYSQVRTDERPSNPPYPRQARSSVSCTWSSASWTEPSIR
jgi:hypothetical protein